MKCSWKGWSRISVVSVNHRMMGLEVPVWGTSPWGGGRGGHEGTWYSKSGVTRWQGKWIYKHSELEVRLESCWALVCSHVQVLLSETYRFGWVFYSFLHVILYTHNKTRRVAKLPIIPKGASLWSPRWACGLAKGQESLGMGAWFLRSDNDKFLGQLADCLFVCLLRTCEMSLLYQDRCFFAKHANLELVKFATKRFPWRTLPQGMACAAKTVVVMVVETVTMPHRAGPVDQQPGQPWLMCRKWMKTRWGSELQMYFQLFGSPWNSKDPWYWEVLGSLERSIDRMRLADFTFCWSQSSRA